MDGRDDVRAAMADLAEGDRGSSTDQLGSIHVVVDDIRPDIDQVRSQRTHGDRIVRLVDDEHVETRALHLADRTSHGQRDDRNVETVGIHPAHEAEQVLLGAAARAGRKDLHHADPAGRPGDRARHRFEAGLEPAWMTGAHQFPLRTKTRWMGSSTAPHSYL
jgi:hypothetical protein